MFITGLFTCLSQSLNEKKIAYAIFFRKITGILEHIIWILQESWHTGDRRSIHMYSFGCPEYNALQSNPI